MNSPEGIADTEFTPIPRTPGTVSGHGKRHADPDVAFEPYEPRDQCAKCREPVRYTVTPASRARSMVS